MAAQCVVISRGHDHLAKLFRWAAPSNKSNELCCKVEAGSITEGSNVSCNADNVRICRVYGCLDRFDRVFASAWNRYIKAELFRSCMGQFGNSTSEIGGADVKVRDMHYFNHSALTFYLG